MKEGSSVALAIMDPDEPHRYLQVRGKVRKVTESGADGHIDSPAKKYLGKDKYPFRRPCEMRGDLRDRADRDAGGGLSLC